MDNLTDVEIQYLITILLCDIVESEEKMKQLKILNKLYQPLIDMNNNILDKLYNKSVQK